MPNNIDVLWPINKKPHCTTGFLSILVANLVFDKIEIFGFGERESWKTDKTEDSTYISCNEISKKWYHDIHYEHCLLNDLINAVGKIVLVEEKHRHLKIANKYAIVWCVDDDITNNTMLLISIKSAIVSTFKCDFFVFTIKSNPFIKYLKDIQQVKLIYIDDEYNKYFKNKNVKTGNYSRYSNFTYARFLLFYYGWVKNYQNVIYLDCDTVVNDNIDNSLLLVADN